MDIRNTIYAVHILNLINISTMSKENLQKLIILALVLVVVALGLTFILNLSNKGSTSDNKLFTLTAKENINRIEVTTNGTLNFAVAKENSNWKVNEFSADNEQVENFLTSVSNAQIASVASNNPSNYSNFDLEDTKAQKVILKSDSGDFTFYIGKSAIGISNYIRIEGKEPVYVIDQNLRTFVTTTVDNLKDRTISNVPVANITSVKTSNQEIKLIDGKWKKGDQELSSDVVDPFLSDVATLKAVSIADSAKSAKVNQIASILMIEITDKDNKTTSYQLFKVENDYFAKKSGDQTVFGISSAQFENVSKKL